METPGISGTLEPCVQYGSVQFWVHVQPGWKHVYFQVCSAVCSPENLGGCAGKLRWKAQREQVKGRRPISTAQGAALQSRVKAALAFTA